MNQYDLNTQLFKQQVRYAIDRGIAKAINTLIEFRVGYLNTERFDVKCNLILIRSMKYEMPKL